MNWNPHFFKELESTQTYLKKRHSEFPEGTVIVAEKQTLGHGRQNRSWTSEQGGLYFSFLLKPTELFQELPQVLLCSILKSLDMLGVSGLMIKWPNDIYIEEQKVSGCLIDSQILNRKPVFYICGVGINLNQNAFPSNYQAVSLKQVLYEELSISVVLEQFLTQFELFYNYLLKGQFKVKALSFLRPFICVDQNKNKIKPEVFFNG